jgi:hypothetical protein
MIQPTVIRDRSVACNPFDARGYFVCRAAPDGGKARAVHEWSYGGLSGTFCVRHSPFKVR